MPSRETIAGSFRNLDFHDDTLIDLRVVPAQQPEEASKSVVGIKLYRYLAKQPCVIRFSGCVNLRVAMDFGVLADNAPTNTSGVDGSYQVGTIA